MLLSACSSTQLGAAALVGSQRISQSDLSSQVSNLQNAAKPYGTQVQLPAAQMPGAVLNWLIDFQVEDQAAANAGVSVTGAQVQTGVVQLDQELQQAASQYGFTNLTAFMLSNGIAPQMVNNVARYLAQRNAIEVKLNGGKPPTQAQAQALQTKVTKSTCLVAKSMNIKVNPQFGQFAYSQGQFGVAPVAYTLSRAAASPSPSPVPTTPTC